MLVLKPRTVRTVRQFPEGGVHPNPCGVVRSRRVECIRELEFVPATPGKPVAHHYGLLSMNIAPLYGMLAHYLGYLAVQACKG